MATQHPMAGWWFENRDRSTPMSAHLRAEIDQSSAAWSLRHHQGIQPVGTRAIGELVPPGYLDTPCAKCGHLPGVELNTNGNMVTNGHGFCNHIGCSQCGFPPPEMQHSDCIFQPYLTAAPVLNATRPNVFHQQTPVSAENLAFLQRHRIPDFWGGANPVPEFWRDLRIAYDQMRAYTENNNPRRRQTFEEEIAREGLDPRLCRRRIIELRLLLKREADREAARVRAHVEQIQANAERARVNAERARVNRYKNRVERFMGDLQRVSYGKLAEGQDCAICLVEYAFQDPQEAGRHMPVLTPCGHVFGADCLEKWLKASVGKGCPMCRADVMSNATGQGTGNNNNHQAALINNNNLNQPVNQGTQGAQSQQVNQGAQSQQVIQGTRNFNYAQFRGPPPNQQVNQGTQGAQSQQVIHGTQNFDYSQIRGRPQNQQVNQGTQSAQVITQNVQTHQSTSNNPSTQVNQATQTRRSARNTQRNVG